LNNDIALELDRESRNWDIATGYGLRRSGPPRFLDRDLQAAQESELVSSADAVKAGADQS
jgi:hypothetical protein